MKKTLLFLFAAAVAVLFSACSSDELASSANDSNVVNVAFNANFDQVIKTRGVAGESDGTAATKLYVAVYNQNNQLIKAISNIGVEGSQPTVTVSGKSATVNFQLVKGQTYNFVFWAQNPNATDGAVVFDPETGKVNVDYTKITANDESLDAFTAHVNNLTVTGAMSQNVTLYRPWAQVNYGATQADWDAAVAAEINVAKSKVTVNNVYKTLNALTGEVEGPAETADIALAANTIPASATTSRTLTVSGTNYKYIGLNYLLVGNEGEQSLIKADLEIQKADGTVINTLAFSNVPVQRNYRTNIIGNLLTSQVQFNITIDPIYDGENNIKVVTTVDAQGNKISQSMDENGNIVAIDAEVKTNEGLTSVLENNTATVENINVKLEEDNLQINFGARKNWGGENTENVTIDGNGKTVTFGGTDSDWSSIGTQNGTITIKNATVNFVRVNGGNNAWNNHALNFSGKVVAENVTFNNSISIADDSEFKNCAFVEEGNFYSFIIKANVRNVVVDGCSFTAPNGRGIKFMDQYIDEDARVQGHLTISNSKFTTAKKAAILVTNTAGAKITASNLNIENVTEDKVNAVWNDSDRTAAWDLVKVVGCTKKQEN